MIQLTVDIERCKGCGLCVQTCPKKILTMNTGLNKAGLHYVECKDQSQCVGCRGCGIICPDGAITIEKN